MCFFIDTDVKSINQFHGEASPASPILLISYYNCGHYCNSLVLLEIYKTYIIVNTQNCIQRNLCSKILYINKGSTKNIYVIKDARLLCYRHINMYVNTNYINDGIVLELMNFLSSNTLATIISKIPKTGPAKNKNVKSNHLL